MTNHSNKMVVFEKRGKILRFARLVWYGDIGLLELLAPVAQYLPLLLGVIVPTVREEGGAFAKAARR
jgi:hypothetical protein